MDNNKDFISRQIDVCKNDKKLVELIAKLALAPRNYYAHIHAASDKVEGEKRAYSLIGIVIQDYSDSSKDAVRSTANITPAIADYIFNIVRRGDLNFCYTEEKLLPNKDSTTGRNPVTKLTICRSDTVKKDGKEEKRRQPWFIGIENGTAVAATNAKGGSYAQKDSFVSEKNLVMSLTDVDMYRMFYNATHFISNWEAAYVPQHIYESEAALAQIIESKKNGNNAAV